MERYITRFVKKNIPAEFHAACIHLMNDDLKNIGPERIVGLGISKQALEEWCKLKTSRLP
ncbi:MAG: hypothetical protein A3E82_08955 [Gammaproteobacteria bacterium RIFCSPHIGHO2_12_FULL_38_11]|nr:MAG: hypothetical protein A3E82_08955 [Gammaproteobacteria bacterium RIFCSPHIGHO2_12_FULL_38_11]